MSEEIGGQSGRLRAQRGWIELSAVGRQTPPIAAFRTGAAWSPCTSRRSRIDPAKSAWISAPATASERGPNMDGRGDRVFCDKVDDQHRKVDPGQDFGCQRLDDPRTGDAGKTAARITQVLGCRRQIQGLPIDSGARKEVAVGRGYLRPADPTRRQHAGRYGASAVRHCGRPRAVIVRGQQPVGQITPRSITAAQSSLTA